MTEPQSTGYAKLMHAYTMLSIQFTLVTKRLEARIRELEERTSK